MEEEDIVTLDSWKEAVRRFWLDILKLDMKKSFSCETCGDLPQTLVFDGIALGVQVEKLKLLQEKIAACSRKERFLQQPSKAEPLSKPKVIVQS